ncbi:MAG: PTS fructose transporter subunit IIA [Gammaproteobacteria bacterium]|jgi:mannose PTS system EIIA component
MSVGLLIITHDQLGANLLQTATAMLDVCPLDAKALAVHNKDDPDKLLEQANELAGEIDDSDGVLVLTDIYGSTPSNIAVRMLKNGHTMVVAGVNLPMLIRILNYPRLNLEELAEKALSGGRDGILLCKNDPWS